MNQESGGTAGSNAGQPDFGQGQAASPWHTHAHSRQADWRRTCRYRKGNPAPLSARPCPSRPTDRNPAQAVPSLRGATMHWFSPYRHRRSRGGAIVVNGDHISVDVMKGSSSFPRTNVNEPIRVRSAANCQKPVINPDHRRLAIRSAETASKKKPPPDPVAADRSRRNDPESSRMISSRYQRVGPGSASSRDNK